MFLLCRCGGLRGWEVVLDLITLTLALSLDGRGDLIGCFVLLYALPCGYCLEASMTGRCGWCWLVVCPTLHLWIADQVRNDVMMLVHRFHPLLPVSGTGTGFGPPPSREMGIPSVGVVLFTRVTLPPLWIDESPITLCQRVRFQRKGVNALSFSS